MALSLATVKAALRIDYVDDDSELSRLILAAEAFVESYTGVRISSASRTMTLLTFKRTKFADYPRTVTGAVTYYNEANVYTVMGFAGYWTDTTQALDAIEFTEVPATYPGTVITVFYTAGYATMPNEIAQVVISLVGLWYNNPEAAQPITMTSVPLGGMFMLEQLRVKAPFS
jgi:uncharacterized phiE125 gp8 family phage protein